MKNFIFISPNFPTNYWMFCRELKKNGLNVLGIGDQPYDELDYNVKENLNQNIYKTIIPRNVRLAEAPIYGQPINIYDPRSSGAESYRLLAEEVINREDN